MSLGTLHLYGGQAAAGLSPSRLIAGGVASLSTAGLLALFAIGGGSWTVERPPEQARATLVWLEPRIVQPPPPGVEVSAVVPPRRAIVTPDRLVTPPAEASQTWITPAPAIAPPASDVPAGLRGLVGKDPCLDPVERLRRNDCPPGFDPKAMASAGAKAVDERHAREQFLAFAERKNCSVLHGCIDDLEPTRPAAAKSATSSLGGMNDTVGRLGPPNWYHADPAFGD